METKRKYTDEPGSDKGAIHLIINKFRGSIFPFCCKNQYDIDTVPVATVEELKAAHTVMLTGGAAHPYQGWRDSNHKQIQVMTQGEYTRLVAQMSVLKEIAEEYSGKTIDNIIAQMEARKKEVNNAN